MSETLQNNIKDPGSHDPNFCWKGTICLLWSDTCGQGYVEIKTKYKYNPFMRVNSLLMCCVLSNVILICSEFFLSYLGLRLFCFFTSLFLGYFSKFFYFWVVQTPRTKNVVHCYVQSHTVTGAAERNFLLAQLATYSIYLYSESDNDVCATYLYQISENAIFQPLSWKFKK